MADSADHALLCAAHAAVNWDKPDKIGVAVSGGSDSMALLHLIAQVAPLHGWTVHAITVDHGLRVASADEAVVVARACVAIGVLHDVVVWNHPDLAGNLPDQARRARYDLIAAWAAAHRIRQVLVGHTQDDQAETFLMGLARKAGVDGLSGMRSTWLHHGVVFSRPFLAVARADLRACLTRRGVGWIDDPTNDDDHYTRVRARRVLAAMRPLGIAAHHLAAVADHLDVARSALNRTTQIAADEGVQIRAGALHLDRLRFQRLPFEIQRRLLNAAVLWLNRAEYAPRGSALDRMQRSLIDGCDSTLAGCRIRVTASEVAICREPKALTNTVSRTDQTWDNRWRVEGPHEPGLEVRALGASGLKACKDWRGTGFSRDALLVSPAIWQGDRLVAAPLAGFSNGWTAEIPASFSRFIVSH